ncbi:MAG: DNA mismatch repair protein MutS [Candidatus Binatia bacterium]
MNDISSFVNPHNEYTVRRQERQGRATHYNNLHMRIGTIRLVTFLIGVGLAWFLVRPGLLSSWWLTIPLAVFPALVVLHERVRRLARLAQRSVAFYEKGLARLEDRWSGQGTAGSDLLKGPHAYAHDLDLFGHGSLFELLCLARTQGGEATLASWLCNPATPDEIRARHAAIVELRPEVDLREDLALQGDDVRAASHPDTLTAWATAPPFSRLLPVRCLAALLAVFLVTSLTGWLLQWFGPIPFYLAILLAVLFVVRVRPRVQRVINEIAWATRELSLLAQILACIERQHFTSPRLATLQMALHTERVPSSQRITQLRRRLTLLESSKNQIFIPIALLLLWDVQLALAIESWRIATGPAIGRWLAAVGEFEALCSLAGYAYEHPDDPFPDIVDGKPCFEGEGLGHPLLPITRCVRNNIHLGGQLRVLIVSGSNMSGKSTLLRTVGSNAVLALAGAPVRAQRLRLSPLAVGSTIRVQDSLQEGSSRFYAEVSRVGLLMDIAKGPLPLLFLLDEIFHGTNSHDRRVGAEAVVQSLVKRDAIGLVTTHDLTLASIAETLSPRAVNVCFEDQFENGKLVFDYQMRPGVVQKSNALALMRSVGLEV